MAEALIITSLGLAGLFFASSMLIVTLELFSFLFIEIPCRCIEFAKTGKSV